MFPTDNLALLQQAMRAAHLRHAADPRVGGRFETAYALWRKHYEVRAAVADQNPTFAAKLLPVYAPLAGTVPSLPLVPAAIRWAVDENAPNTITLTVDVSLPVVVQVTPPNGANPYNAPITVAPTRQTANFMAVVDGLYALQVSVNGRRLPIVYVPVSRSLFLEFRQKTRYLRFDFELDQNPPATPEYSEMLAVLYAADAAAATGDPSLYGDLIALAQSIAPAPTPIALFPHGI